MANSNLPFEIRRPDLARYAKILVFGPWGSGKTTLIGSAVEDERTAPMLLLNFEGGESSLAGLGVDVVDIDSWEKYNDVLAYLRSGTHHYKSVGLDSITETHVFALFKLLDDDADNRENTDLIQVGDYGIASVQLRRLIRDFRDLKMHVFMTALSKIDTDPREGQITTLALSGKLAGEIPGIVDAVLYISRVDVPNDDPKLPSEEGRALIFHSYRGIRTKFRLPLAMAKTVPSEIVNPTVTSMLDALHYE